MKTWTRWSDWTSVVAGAFLMFVPLFTADSGDNATVWVAELLGAGIILVALGALANPANQAFEQVGAVLGVALFASPWVFGYSGLDGAAGSAWIVGALLTAMSLLGNREIRQQADRDERVLQQQ